MRPDSRVRWDHVSEGYERDGAPDTKLLNAVRWWFYYSADGFQFARGGRCRTARVARDELRSARNALQREHASFCRRPTHVLGRQGQLRPIARARG